MTQNFIFLFIVLMKGIKCSEFKISFVILGVKRFSSTSSRAIKNQCFKRRGQVEFFNYGVCNKTTSALSFQA